MLYQVIGSIILLIISIVLCLLTEGRDYHPGRSGTYGSGGPITYQTTLGPITDLMGNYRSGSPPIKPRAARPQKNYIWYPAFVVVWLCFANIVYCFLRCLFAQS